MHDIVNDYNTPLPVSSPIKINGAPHMPKDLRYFLKEMQKKMPEELAEVDRAVDPKFELSGVLRKLQDED